MSKIENIYEVTKKLLGEIDPQGESNIDRERLENLEHSIEVVEKLIDDIIWVSKYKDRYESSMKTAGMTANKFIQRLRENINES